MVMPRIIPCLDVRDGRVVKGVRFEGLVDIDDPVECAGRYGASGADELCFLDVTASVDRHPLLVGLIERVARKVFIPLTVGGGVTSVEQGRRLLRAGADKIAVSTAAVESPRLISALATAFGQQCVVLSIDTRSTAHGWRVTTHGGRRLTDLDTLTWARWATDHGAGEILLNIIDTDGTRRGFELDMTDDVAGAVRAPVIASGGAGAADHFVALFQRTRAAAALAASIFHDGSHTPAGLKSRLGREGIRVRQ